MSAGGVTVYDERPCTLGEGALWHPEREQFFWFDILERKLLSRDGAGQREWRFDVQASAAGWVDRYTLLIASETGLNRFDIETGDIEPVAAIEADDPRTRSNDGRADPFGGFWIGTMGKRAEAGSGTIYRYYRGAVVPIVRDLTIPNAICFSPDRKLAYYTDTEDGRIMAQPLDGEGWPEGKAHVFADLRPENLSPDGAVTDAEGALWNAQWGAGRVARYLPDGKLDRIIEIGGLHTSCPAFGGPDFTQLLITTALEGLSEPDAAQGLTYLFETGLRGRAEPRVML